MKLIVHPRFPLKGLVAALAAATLGSFVATATPYATSLTNNFGTNVCFRLNQNTDTNDTVLVISGAGSITNVLQLPGSASGLSRGLISTNINVGPGAFQVYIKHIGSGTISTNSPTLLFGTPRGLAANCNPASPYFGWVYVSNAATNSSRHGDGIFAFTSDLSDAIGQGNVPRNGGYTGFSSDSSWSPYKISVAPDDSVLVCDDSDSTANLISMPPLLTSFQYVLKQIATNPATGKVGAAPVGSINNHGSMAHAIMVGSGSSRVLYTMDEDYQRDPTSGLATEWNSVWRYDIGNGPLPWSNAPNAKLMTPFINSFAGQNQGIQVGTNGLIYVCQRRSNSGQYDVYIADGNNPMDPNNYSGLGGFIWDSQSESLAEGYSDDVLRDMNQIAVSPDGRWLAGIIAGGSGYNIFAPDGSTFQTYANDIIVIPLTNGIPNLAARQTFRFPGSLGNGRDVAFDRANNVYLASSGMGIVQSLDLGESVEATTGSDGTFTITLPPTQVSVTASTPLAYEAGPTAGVFTLTRTADDVSAPLTVVYNVGGTAQSADYVPLTGTVTFAPGETTTNIEVLPIDDAIVEPTETVTLNLKGSGGYIVGFPQAATVSILDNETPQLQILSLSTNIYQGTTNDYAAIRIRRLGDLSVPITLDASSFAFGGTAVLNSDYYLANVPFTIDPGVVDVTNRILYPLTTSTAVGRLSILLTNVAQSGYTVVNNTATTYLTLRGVPPETVLWSDQFETDSSANWKVNFGTTGSAAPDYNLIWNYDYSVSGLGGNVPALPPAPHSAAGATHGLYMTVNKNDAVAAAAALNLYPIGQSFTNNFALRFDMFLLENSSGSLQSKNEYALCGINHDTAHTNWFRNAQPGLDAGSTCDGIFFDIESDGGNAQDFGLWTTPMYTNGSGVFGPTNAVLTRASAMQQIFKKPPYSPYAANGGSAGNDLTSPNPTWAEVEIAQIGNNVIWKINNTIILTYTNNGAFTNGNIMIGYEDGWDDIGNSTPGSGEASVIYDNVRVVQLSAPAFLTQPTNALADAGGSATFSATVSTTTGTTNLQWYRNGTAIAGATGLSLTINPVAFTNYATYALRVDDGAYGTWSTNVTLRPATPPSITTPPVANIVAAVNTATNASVVAATYSSQTNYQWYLNNKVVSGATTNPFNFTVRSTNYGPAMVTVSDGFNFVTNTFTVSPPVPVITVQPVSLAAVEGGSPTFSVTAQTFSGVTNYQWMYYGTNLSGKTSRTLTLANVQAISFGGPYTVRVSDGTTSITSAPPVTLTHAVSPGITSPAALTGGSFRLSFGTEVGPAYVVDFKSALTNAAWTPIKTNAGTGGVINVTNNPTGTPEGYYRIRLQ